MTNDEKKRYDEVIAKLNHEIEYSQDQIEKYEASSEFELADAIREFQSNMIILKRNFTGLISLIENEKARIA